MIASHWTNAVSLLCARVNPCDCHESKATLRACKHNPIQRDNAKFQELDGKVAFNAMRHELSPEFKTAVHYGRKTPVQAMLVHYAGDCIGAVLKHGERIEYFA